jgi:glycosyltransferase involved in cell wall biosynthesis
VAKDLSLSVIIPVYNTAAYLPQCLDSAINQTLQNIEIICVDDCGSDNSAGILRRYARRDARLKISRHQRNLGLGAARNTGIRLARGAYIGFLDSDDWLDTDYFAGLYAQAQKHNADIAQGFIKFFDQNTGKTAEHPQNNLVRGYSAAFNKLLATYKLGTCWNKIYKRRFLLDNQLFFPEGIYWEDNPFTLQCFTKTNKITSADQSSYYYYRQRSLSITAQKTKKLHFDLLSAAAQTAAYLNSLSDIPARWRGEFYRELQDRLATQKTQLQKEPATERYAAEFTREATEILNSIQAVAFWQKNRVCQRLYKKIADWIQC